MEKWQAVALVLGAVLFGVILGVIGAEIQRRRILRVRREREY